jgi:hypothetical protein
MRLRRQVSITASAYNSPSTKLSREIAAVCVIVFETLSSAARTFCGYGMLLNATHSKMSLCVRRSTSTIATSMPSSEVPLMMPATLMASVEQDRPDAFAQAFQLGGVVAEEFVVSMRVSLNAAVLGEPAADVFERGAGKGMF